MKVKELMRLLTNVDPEREVILQKDGEGNGYSPLTGIDDNAAYSAECTWGGSVKKQTLSAADIERGFGAEDVAAESAKPCVVLYPVN